MGCLWIKFTPIFPAVTKCISTLLVSVDSPDVQQNLVSQHAAIMQGAIWLGQLLPEQDKSSLPSLLASYLD